MEVSCHFYAMASKSSCCNGRLSTTQLLVMSEWWVSHPSLRYSQYLSATLFPPNPIYLFFCWFQGKTYPMYVALDCKIDQGNLIAFHFLSSAIKVWASILPKTFLFWCKRLSPLWKLSVDTYIIRENRGRFRWWWLGSGKMANDDNNLLVK